MKRKKVLKANKYSKKIIDDDSVSEDELIEEQPIPKRKNIKLVKRKKRKLKKWVYFFLLFIIIGGGFITYKIIKEKKRIKLEEETMAYIEDVKSHYNEYVKTNTKTNLYTLNNGNYEVIGTIYSDVNLNLDSIKIDKNTKYFKISDTDYYVEYKKVNKSNKEELSQRYKNYLPFNKNIVTKDGFILYKDDNPYISLNKGMEFPIIINDYEDKYYVEYDNRLLSVKKEDVAEVKNNENTKKKNQSKITTLAYHRVYDTDEKCTDPYICIKKSSFDEEMKYLKDNNYFTLNMEEMYMYLKGNLQVEKAVCLTFDDGYLYKSAEEVLEKYDLNGTMFVITSHFIDFDKFHELKRLDIQSHTDNMHRNYVCPKNSSGSQGGAILCASEKEIKDDFQKSLDKLGVEPWGLAFPFYDYNDKAIKALKDTGLKMAFIGRAGQMGRATPNKTDLFKIPRMTVWEQSIMSFKSWKSYL